MKLSPYLVRLAEAQPRIGSDASRFINGNGTYVRCVYCRRAIGPNGSRRLEGHCGRPQCQREHKRGLRALRAWEDWRHQQRLARQELEGLGWPH